MEAIKDSGAIPHPKGFMEIDKLTKAELEKLQVEKEIEKQLSIQSQCVVELKDDELASKVADLQAERKRLASAITQGKFNLRRLASELNVIKIQIWKKLSEGES